MDYKINKNLIKKLQNDLTAKSCELIFIKVEELAKNRKGIEHKSYLDLYGLIQTEDSKIAEMLLQSKGDWDNIVAGYDA